VKVRFTTDFDWSPPAFRGTVTTAFKAGQTHTVTRECAAAAVKAGKGEVVKERRREAGEGA
jgi:hypothetical protein